MLEIQKINLKNIIKNSFKFLVFEWKLFALVLAFYLFRHLTFGQNHYTSNDRTQLTYEILANGISQNIIYLFFWVSIIPLIIFAVNEFLTKRQRISFKRDMIIGYFVPLFIYQLIFSILDFLISFVLTFFMFNSTLMPELVIKIFLTFLSLFNIILQFILFLTPVIIVLENKTFFDGTKKSVEIIRNKLKECVTFYLILVIVISFLFSIPNNINFLYILITGTDIVIPGYNYLQLILTSGWFIFYIAAIVGFYLIISEDRKFGYKKQ
ncbi:hypothetical protein ANME2D_00995 [Candidatus Methanoperedens nitroreducens]|uniref:Uncharacterized protein n=1 Tax=Candidatus Methanoperedens nitratireducens TaxID=1392998 RepID=A0A062V097_9EURY|nr:hypothetical protein [Candidatus Methanoperedens nitroreducens]KCZ72566.1 hypothetical protein ANME2D_00995 [Candidatus Methanoperedens nitroreducens]MDJ1423502.1 hypothetical protein [Candidatus Methanoperedens sp.]